MRDSVFNPFTFGGAWGGMGYTPGYTPTKKEWHNGMRPTPGSFQAQMSPEMEALRKGFLGNSMDALGGQENSVPGFLGISPEMWQQFQDSNKGMGQDFMDASRGYLKEEQQMGPYDFQGTYDDRLKNMRQQDQPYEDRTMSQNFDNQYGKGVLASTAGQYQTEGLQDSFNRKDLQRHDTAFDQAMGLGDQYDRRRQMLQQAGATFGGMGQGTVENRFARAMAMFGGGQDAENARMGRAGGYMQGMGGLDQFFANLMQMSGNMGAQRSNANAQAWNPYIQSHMNSDAAGNDFLGQVIGGMTIPFGGGGFNTGGAQGGPAMAGQPYLVGEHGPEVITPQQNGMIHPNPNTPSPLNPMNPMPGPMPMPAPMNSPMNPMNQQQMMGGASGMFNQLSQKMGAPGGGFLGGGSFGPGRLPPGMGAPYGGGMSFPHPPMPFGLGGGSPYPKGPSGGFGGRFPSRPYLGSSMATEKIFGDYR
jgi:hypothetical protein